MQNFEILNSLNLLDFSHSLAAKFFKNYDYPWQMLSEIKNLILEIGKSLDENYVEIKKNVWVHKTTKIASTAFIDAPCIIGANSEIRHCAFIRGSVLVGENCVVGNSCEIKNSILFDNVQVSHFNYVGDSILGYKSHLGAGAITSNLKSDRSLVTIKFDETKIETNLKKFGAIVGDFVEVGCNSVLNPGTILGRNTVVYPLTSCRGYYAPNQIVKSTNCVVKKF